MTPTEISQAYAELHDKWPELRPNGIVCDPYNRGTHDWWDDGMESVMTDDLAHSACFLACLKACANRGCDVAFPADWGDPKFYETVALIYVNIANPHTITEVMDRVMQLPKVNT